MTVLAPSDSLTKVLAIELSIGATLAAFAYFKYITSDESLLITSLSKILKVDLILLVIKSLAERITELVGVNGIAIN